MREVNEVGNEARLFFNELGPFLEHGEMFKGQEAESKCAILRSISI